MRFRLPADIRDKLVNLPETGMGVQIVTLVLGDGRRVRDVHVAWCETIVRFDTMPSDFDPGKVIDVEFQAACGIGGRALIEGTLEEITGLLEECGDTFWPPVLQQFQSRVQQLLAAKPPEIVGLFKDLRRLISGMRSLSDLNISRLNGHKVVSESLANRELQRLVNRLDTDVSAAAKRYGLP